MGKKSSRKDRGYMTATEWKTEGGGCKREQRLDADRQRHGSARRNLPFHCCALSFTPFADPVMLREDADGAADGGGGGGTGRGGLGFLFDITQLVPYVQKYGSSPISGRKVTLRDVLTVALHKNGEGAYHCPILNKVFTEHTAIVAVRTKGGDACNVYSRQAVEELNLRPKHFRDLLTDLEFSRRDVITLQDPLNLDGKDAGEFDHVRRERAAAPAAGAGAGGLGNVSEDVKRALRRIDGGGGPGGRAEFAPMPASIEPRGSRMIVPKKPGTHTWNTDEGAAGAAPRGAGGGAAAPAGKESIFTRADARRTTGACSRSFTSSVFSPTTTNARERVVVERNPTKKAYLRMDTSAGHVNVELHADLAPRTCENFITLARRG